MHEGVKAGADSRYGSYRRRLLRPSPTVLDRALPERASTDWVPARIVRAPDTDWYVPLTRTACPVPEGMEVCMI